MKHKEDECDMCKEKCIIEIYYKEFLIHKRFCEKHYALNCLKDYKKIKNVDYVYNVYNDESKNEKRLE